MLSCCENQEQVCRRYGLLLGTKHFPIAGMKYHIFGHDGEAPEEQLARFKGTVNWSYLRPHYERGSLFYVDRSLELEEVGKSLVEDDREQVKNWLRSGLLTKIEARHADQWKEKENRFLALVVSPFVLCRLEED